MHCTYKYESDISQCLCVQSVGETIVTIEMKTAAVYSNHVLWTFAIHDKRITLGFSCLQQINQHPLDNSHSELHYVEGSGDTVADCSLNFRVIAELSDQIFGYHPYSETCMRNREYKIVQNETTQFFGSSDLISTCIRGSQR